MEKKKKETKCECGSDCHCEENKASLADAKKALNVLNEKLLRSQADLVNYRTRKDQEVSQMLNYANEDLIRDMLPIVDSFERAIAMESKNKEMTKYLEGFKITYTNLLKVLEQYGVQEIAKINVPFDPTKHQAIMTEHKEKMKPDMVITVLQKGYLYKEKVLRPAMVKVSK